MHQVGSSILVLLYLMTVFVCSEILVGEWLDSTSKQGTNVHPFLFTNH